MNGMINQIFSSEMKWLVHHRMFT